jgi:hypothetical protein
VFTHSRDHQTIIFENSGVVTLEGHEPIFIYTEGKPQDTSRVQRDTSYDAYRHNSESEYRKRSYLLGIMADSAESWAA